LRRTASFDVLSVKIGLTDSPVGELKYQKSVVLIEGVYISPIWRAKTPGWIEPSFFGGRGPWRNHAIQICWRLVQGPVRVVRASLKFNTRYYRPQTMFAVFEFWLISPLRLQLVTSQTMN